MLHLLSSIAQLAQTLHFRSWSMKSSRGDIGEIDFCWFLWMEVAGNSPVFGVKQLYIFSFFFIAEIKWYGLELK